MSTTPFRGLPPPAAMTFSQSSQSQSTTGPSQFNLSMGQLPDLPPQPKWQGTEESICNWLLAKAEEDKRKQEEEKTRQEALRLEQRKVEHDMLKALIGGGIPPFLIPMIFSGMSGGEISSNKSFDSNHNNFTPTNCVQQSQLTTQTSFISDQGQRKDSRSSQKYGDQMLHSIPSSIYSKQYSKSMTTNEPQLNPSFTKNHQISSESRVAHQLSYSQEPFRQTRSSDLSRLGANEILPEPAKFSSSMLGVSKKNSSPPIHFHHWQPPSAQTEKNNSHKPITLSDQNSSPKKRRNLDCQLPAPSSIPQKQHRSLSSFSEKSSNILNPTLTRAQRNSRQRRSRSPQDFDTYRERLSHHVSTEPTCSGKISSPPYQITSSPNKQGSIDSEVNLNNSNLNSASNLLDLLEPSQVIQQHPQQSHNHLKPHQLPLNLSKYPNEGERISEIR